MRTEKEIIDRLKRAWDDYRSIEDYFDAMPTKNLVTEDIRDALSATEMEISVLSWVLGS